MLPVTALTLALAVAPSPVIQLERLARLYHAYELPLPPKDAKLIRYAPSGGNFPTPSPRVGFLLNEARPSLPPGALFGTATETAYTPYTAEIKPDPKVVTPAEVSLPTAVQFYLRGWHDLAVAVFKDGGNWKGENTERSLAMYAVVYWRIELADPTVDRAKVARRLASIRQAESTVFTKNSDEFYAHLLLSLKPSAAKPGTVEADIDELLDVCDAVYSTFPLHDHRYADVVARGFDAVPALIDHLSDNRLTRNREFSFINRGWSRDDRVKHFASDAIVGLLHDGEAKKNADGVVRAKDARRWWAEAQKAGEEAFAVVRVLKAKGDESRPNLHLLLLIARKYPERLPEVFRSMLADHPEMSLEEIADAVAGSSLSADTKRKVFVEAAESKNVEWQRVGRESLREVAPDEYRERLLGVMKSLPASPSTDFITGPECEFVRELLPCDDPVVWTVAEKYLKGADVSLRLVWLRAMTTGEPDATRHRRVTFLAAFLSDEAVCDAKNKPDLFPSRRNDYPDLRKVEVRNFAATELGAMLRVKTKPALGWTVDEWKAFRDEVAQAAKK